LAKSSNWQVAKRESWLNKVCPAQSWKKEGFGARNALIWNVATTLSNA